MSVLPLLTARLWGEEVSMPWKECSAMDQRLPFVAKLLDGESMSDACREFGIPARSATRSSIGTRRAASKR